MSVVTVWAFLVLPALLYSLAYPLGVFLPIVLVQVGGFDVRRGRGVGIVQEGLDAGQYRRNIVGRRPSVLKDVQAQLTGAVDVGMEHLRDELHPGRLVRVGFFELHYQSEGAIFEGCVCGTDDDGVPGNTGLESATTIKGTSTALETQTYHVMTLSAIGEAETPAGGSVCMRCESGSVHRFRAKEFRNRSVERLAGQKRTYRRVAHTLKSRIKRRLAEVDIAVVVVGVLR